MEMDGIIKIFPIIKDETAMHIFVVIPRFRQKGIFLLIHDCFEKLPQY